MESKRDQWEQFDDLERRLEAIYTKQSRRDYSTGSGRSTVVDSDQCSLLFLNSLSDFHPAFSITSAGSRPEKTDCVGFHADPSNTFHQRFARCELLMLRAGSASALCQRVNICQDISDTNVFCSATRKQSGDIASRSFSTLPQQRAREKTEIWIFTCKSKGDSHQQGGGFLSVDPGHSHVIHLHRGASGEVSSEDAELL